MIKITVKHGVLTPWLLPLLLACSSTKPINLSISNVPEAARCARAMAELDSVKDPTPLFSPISGIEATADVSFVLPREYARKAWTIDGLQLFSIPCQEVTAQTPAIATSFDLHLRSSEPTNGQRHKVAVQIAPTLLSNSQPAPLPKIATPFAVCDEANFDVAPAQQTKRSPITVEGAFSSDGSGWTKLELPLLRQTSPTQTMICVKENTKRTEAAGGTSNWGLLGSTHPPTSRLVDWHVAIVDVASRATLASTKLEAALRSNDSGNKGPRGRLLAFVVPHLVGIDLVATGSKAGIAVTPNASTLAFWDDNGLTFRDLISNTDTRLDVPTTEATGDFTTEATFILRSSKNVLLFAKPKENWSVVAGHDLSTGSYPRGSALSTDGKWHVGRTRDRVSASHLGSGTVIELMTIAPGDDVARSDFVNPSTLVVFVLKAPTQRGVNNDTILAHRFKVLEGSIEPLDTIEASGPRDDRAMTFGKTYYATSQLGELRVMDGSSREVCSIRGLAINDLRFQSETLLEARHRNGTSLIDVARCGESLLLPSTIQRLNDQDLAIVPERNGTRSVVDIRGRTVLCNLPVPFGSNIVASSRNYILGTVHGEDWAAFRIATTGPLCTGQN